MMKAPLACLLLLSLFSARKKAENPRTKQDPGPFYNHFKMNDTTYYLAEYQDLTQCEFRMPIWLNDPY
jgi:hypothetical protein